MQGGPTSVADEDKQVSVNDSTSRATSAARTTPCPSSLHRAGPSCAATVSVRIAQLNVPDKS